MTNYDLSPRRPGTMNRGLRRVDTGLPNK
jgi:hypothetical protein